MPQGPLPFINPTAGPRNVAGDPLRTAASVSRMREVGRHRMLQVLADTVRDAKLFDGHAGKEVR